ncbi:MAG: succinylglutamate desuccinylase/aspartoacylase family protein [Eggerthellaceae bacterium]|jgi:predicted deacylase
MNSTAIGTARLCLPDRRLDYADVLAQRNRKFQGKTYVAELDILIPTTIIAGALPGPTAFITSGIHGAEYCGIAAVMKLARKTNPGDVQGSLIILHCCNQKAFYGHTIGIMPEDGLNLNRAFPTSDKSTHTHRVASFLEGIVDAYCDYHIDVHSGDANEALSPHCYYSANEELGPIAERSRAMALHADMPFAVATWANHCVYQNSNFRGVPSVLLEMGEQGRWSNAEAEEYCRRIERLLGHIGVLEQPAVPPLPTADITKAKYLEAPEQGCWIADIAPGQRFAPGERLGSIYDFFGNELARITAREAGTVLYMTSSLSISKGSPLIAYACQ